MVPIIIFVAGVAVGIGSCKLYDMLKNDSNNRGARCIESQYPKSYVSDVQQSKSCDSHASDLDISSLESIMRRYGVDITASNCLYLLCSRIKSLTYKKLLDDIVENTQTGEDLISYINSVHVETFAFPTGTSLNGRFFMPIATIEQLLSTSGIVSESTDPKTKVELLINAAYTSAISRLKTNFGVELSKLIKAYEEGRDLQPFYNDIIKEVGVSRDFLKA